MIIKDLKKLWPAGLVLSGVLGFIAIPRDLMNVGNALGDWLSFLPFGLDLLPKLVCLGLIAYGGWRYFRIYVLPLFAHKVGLWKYDRISMVEFMRRACERHGWNFSDSSLDVLDLIKGIGQACGEGRVQAHGRFNPRKFTGVLDRIYLVPIRESYWRWNYIEAYDAYRSANNLTAVSISVGDTDKREYMDLHLNRIQALAWLEREGPKWQGQSDREKQNKVPSSSLRAAE